MHNELFLATKIQVFATVDLPLFFPHEDGRIKENPIEKLHYLFL
jgi:hypothetical protein